jgi:hypothetical protein
MAALITLCSTSPRRTSFRLGPTQLLSNPADANDGGGSEFAVASFRAVCSMWESSPSQKFRRHCTASACTTSCDAREGRVRQPGTIGPRRDTACGRRQHGDVSPNRILACLSRADLSLLEPNLEVVELPVQQLHTRTDAQSRLTCIATRRSTYDDARNCRRPGASDFAAQTR